MLHKEELLQYYRQKIPIKIEQMNRKKQYKILENLNFYLGKIYDKIPQFSTNYSICLSHNKKKFQRNINNKFFIKLKGFINCNDKIPVIYINLNYKDYLKTFIHELGHIYWNQITEKEKKDFLPIFEEEKEKQDYFILDIEEYFAESFVHYICNDTKSILFPKTIHFFTKIKPTLE